MEYGNGIRSEYQYGEDGILSSLVTVTAKGEVLLNYDYAYDGNGNCTRKSGERYQNDYAYDQMNSLIEAEYNGSRENYAYDLAGNRLKKETEKEHEVYAYNIRNQLLRLEKGAEVTDYHYYTQGNLLDVYDLAGNRLKKETAEGTELYSYNARNQLLQMEKGGNATLYRYDLQGNMLQEAGYDRKEYTYDALNRQAGVSVNGLGQINRYDGEGLRYETEKSGKTAFYLFDRGELTAETGGDTVGRYARGYDVVYSEYNGEGGGYHIQDEAKSTLFILGKDHEIKKSYRYDAFGRVLEESGEIQNRITYTGQMYDGATEQYYLRARFYNPTIGRFIQEDVYRGDGLNLYAYCANNPVMYYDPSGYMGLCPVGSMQPSKKKGEWDPESGFYSVAFEAQLPENMYPGVSERRHFQEANKQLHEAFEKNPELALQMEKMYPGIIDAVKPGARGVYPEKKPTVDLTWHHEPNREGVLQLVPTKQHKAAGKIQSVLHPNNKGGMENWGGGRKKEGKSKCKFICPDCYKQESLNVALVLTMCAC